MTVVGDDDHDLIVAGQEQATQAMAKMKENSFDFNDFLDQMDQITKMGPLEDLLKMMPGMANNPALQNINLDPKQFAHIKAIIYSMVSALVVI